MAQAKAASAKQPNVLQRFMKYLKDVRSELGRVVWPQQQDVVNSSLVVLVMLLIMTAFVSIVDLGASQIIIEWLAKIGR